MNQTEVEEYKPWNKKINTTNWENKLKFNAKIIPEKENTDLDQNLKNLQLTW